MPVRKRDDIRIPKEAARFYAKIIRLVISEKGNDADLAHIREDLVRLERILRGVAELADATGFGPVKLEGSNPSIPSK